MMRILVLIVIITIGGCNSRPSKENISIFAASSLLGVVQDLSSHYSDSTGIEIQINSASSGTLAQQIQQGAACDIYLSANSKWMDYLETNHLLNLDTRCSPAKNQLVLVAYNKIKCTDSFDITTLPSIIKRHIALGDPNHVPAGSYATEALQHLNIYSELETLILPAKDVGSALRYVENGECDYGVVYQTNALASEKVKLLYLFPDSLHQAIQYEAACIKPEKTKAISFLQFICSEENDSIWVKYGFNK